jgi:hypothetical protein
MAAREAPIPKVRCPYCVDHNDFRPMVVMPGDRHICRKCGHIVSPSEASFVCGCMKCVRVRDKGLLRILPFYKTVLSDE